jgi:hypothetical protein
MTGREVSRGAALMCHLLHGTGNGFGLTQVPNAQVCDRRVLGLARAVRHDPGMASVISRVDG